MAAQPDHYEVLGVRNDADIVVIRAAYRALAKRYHPDTSKEPRHLAEASFKKINTAFSVLSDPQNREIYD